MLGIESKRFTVNGKPIFLSGCYLGGRFRPISFTNISRIEGWVNSALLWLESQGDDAFSPLKNGSLDNDYFFRLKDYLDALRQSQIICELVFFNN